MRQSTRDFTARRISPSFDTELPPDARSELIRPRRPVILHRPVYEPPDRSGILKWADSILVVAILLIGVITNHQQNERAPKQNAPIAPTPGPSVQPSPTPAQPAVQPPVTQTRLVQRPAPRAELLKLPPPRAQLVRLPEWQIGETRPVMMPYNIEVLARYEGRLTSEAVLPTNGNAIGDTWAVGDNVWVWLVAPGTSTAQWVDP
jgi:hypothetical protein